MVICDPHPINLLPPVFFLSDAHLGAEKGEVAARQEKNLNLFLDRVEREGKALVLAGDLFDFWYEWNTVIPKRYFWLLHRLRNVVDKGIPVLLLAGNHDFRIHGFLETDVGLTTHQNAIILQIADTKIFVYHGDGILARDRGYRLMKKVFRSTMSQKLFSWIHPDLGMLLARGTSMTSRNSTKGDPLEDQEYAAFAKAQLADGMDGVVMGHAHRPMEISEGNKTYVNLGDWIIHYTFAVHDGRALKLHHFEKEQTPTAGLA